MANEVAKIDNNYKKTLLGVTDDASAEIRRILVDPTTGRLKCSATVTATFLSLSDTPSAYTGQSGKVVAVKATEDGLEFIAAGTVDGSGTANELPYWVDSNTLGTLAVATYPSLTELAFLKGTSSAIQTQLNAKGAGDMLLGTVQAVTAEKTFTNSKLTILGSSTGKNTFTMANSSASDYVTTIPAVTGTVALGTGTANEIPYWTATNTLGALAVATYPSLTELSYVKGLSSAVQTQLGTKAPSTAPTFATSITGSYLTASEILITDGSKNIVSAPVATYPSLTELSYVKGVTSAVQTQLGTKAPSASPTFTGTVILPKTLEIQDTSADHQYVLAVSELTADRTITLPLLTTADEFVFKDHSQTLTNKRINPRVVTAASYTTDTGTSLDVSTCDQFQVTAQAGALKFNNPGGTPAEGQKLTIRIKDDGTARALTYDTQFRAMGAALPSTTVLSKTLYLGLIFNNTDTKWDLVAAAQEA